MSTVDLLPKKKKWYRQKYGKRSCSFNFEEFSCISEEENQIPTLLSINVSQNINVDDMKTEEKKDEKRHKSKSSR